MNFRLQAITGELVQFWFPVTKASRMGSVPGGSYQRLKKRHSRPVHTDVCINGWVQGKGSTRGADIDLPPVMHSLRMS